MDNSPLRFTDHITGGQVRLIAQAGMSRWVWARAQNNTSGLANIAIGNAAMKSNTTGSFNTVIGDSAAYTMNASDEECLSEILPAETPRVLPVVQ